MLYLLQLQYNYTTFLQQKGDMKMIQKPFNNGGYGNLYNSYQIPRAGATLKYLKHLLYNTFKIQFKFTENYLATY